jgi:CheY-like chemotaxis protein
VGVELGEADSGVATLTARQGGEWDLVVRDVQLGDRNSIEMMPELRAAMRRRGPILGLSASVLKAEANQARDAGFDAFLGKPFREEALFERIGQLLELDWIYRSEPIETKPATGGRDDEGPIKLPRAELEELQALAKIGNIRGLRTALESLAVHNGEGRRLEVRLQPLIKRYRMAEIRDLLVRIEVSDGVKEPDWLVLGLT